MSLFSSSIGDGVTATSALVSIRCWKFSAPVVSPASSLAVSQIRSRPSRSRSQNAAVSRSRSYSPLETSPCSPGPRPVARVVCAGTVTAGNGGLRSVTRSLGNCDSRVGVRSASICWGWRPTTSRTIVRPAVSVVSGIVSSVMGLGSVSGWNVGQRGVLRISDAPRRSRTVDPTAGRSRARRRRAGP